MSLCHHPSGLPAWEAAGEPRLLAAWPSPPRHAHSPFAARHAPMPREAWRPRDVRWLGLPIGDQDGVGACGGFGACRQFTVAHRLAGHPPREFSPWFVYATVNGGVDRGAVVSDLLTALQTQGVALAADVPAGEYRLDRIAPAARRAARRFRARECHSLHSFDEAATAWQLGFAVGIGIDVGTRFVPDADGFLPDRHGRAGGHYMGTEGLVFARGQWWLIAANSWTARWGRQGYCYVPESYCRDGWFEGFAIRSVTDDPEDPDDGAPVPPAAR